jgi:transcriptional regulator with XRE-family HTH domain
MTIGEAVKERILQLCAERSITVNKLATLSGVTKSTLNNIVGWRNRSATISTIKKLCDGFDIDIVKFFSTDTFRDLDQELK